MSIIELIILALVLSIDSFAVSVSCGIGCNTAYKFLKVAIIFSVFQALMPIAGWLIGSAFSGMLNNFDHWIAFSLLLFIGMKMIFESLGSRENKNFNIQQNKILIMLAVATSIDALIVGVGFGLLGINIFAACILIGIVTFMASMLGGFFGNRSGKYFGSRAEFTGGIILIGLGVKILLEHL